MHVHDKLLGQPLRTLARHLGYGGLSAAYLIEGTVGFVHGDKGRGHAGGSLEERAPAHALMTRQLAGVLLDPVLELALRRGLRRRHEFVAGHGLSWDRRRKGSRLSRQPLTQVF